MRVVVLGGGPGGYVCAIRAAQLGAKVTLIEKKHLGGTCLNVGCIPTKVLLHTAELYKVMKEEADSFGIGLDNLHVDWPKLQARKDMVIGQLVGGVGTLLDTNNIRMVAGEGKFLDKSKIEVKLSDGGKEIIEFDKAVIATGSSPVKVPIPGVELEGVITSDEALSLSQVPKSLCIIGGGVIGTEFASVYASLGTEVTIVEMLPEILGNIDSDIAACLKNKLMEDGVKIYTRAKVESIQKDGEKLKIHTTSNAGSLFISTEKVLLSIGRKPAIDNIGLENLGIKKEKNRILVDKRMKTNVENIYAIGDCNGGILLAHVASAEGMIAAENMMGKSSKIDFKTVPSCIYTRPELASVGLTEAEAKKQGYAVKTGVFPLYANGKSMIMGEGEGMVKFVVDAHTDEILGLHMAGPRATDLIVEGALAIRLEATIDEIITTIHAHPTVGEAIHEAAHAVHGNAIHLPKI